MPTKTQFLPISSHSCWLLVSRGRHQPPITFIEFILRSTPQNKDVWYCERSHTSIRIDVYIYRSSISSVNDCESSVYMLYTLISWLSMSLFFLKRNNSWWITGLMSCHFIICPFVSTPSSINFQTVCLFIHLSNTWIYLASCHMEGIIQPAS